MRAMLGTMRAELVGAGGVVERNAYLTKRYIWWDLAWFVWTVANTLTIVFIADGVQATGGSIDVARATTFLLIGAVIWAYLGIIFEFMTETVAWERWEGTLEYTFMAPIRRWVQLLGSTMFAVMYGLIHTTVILVVLTLFFWLDLSSANFVTAGVMMVLGSLSFIGIGMMAAVLPLMYVERGAQMTFVLQSLILLVSGVYYSVEVLPQWMQTLSKFSPATYVLEGVRAGLIEGVPITDLWSDVWPLLIMAVVFIPLGIWIFGRAEKYAKKTGKLKRVG